MSYPDCQLPDRIMKIKPLGKAVEYISKFSAGSLLPIKGWGEKFELSGSKELLQIGVDCGLGAKNDGGFGCIIPPNGSS